MKMFKKICFVLLMTIFLSSCSTTSSTPSSVYGGSCFKKPTDVDDCRKKAEQGDPNAQVILGWLYEEGQGVRKDYKQAVKWYRKAADQGDGLAQYTLGLMYKNGQGVRKDYKQAVKWFRKSAEQRYKGAQYNLGDMYYRGQGVRKDYKQAVRWFRKSAEQGVVRSQIFLGVVYIWGQGVPKDYVMAHMYLNIAAVSGDKTAIKSRDSIEKKMTSSQIAEAQELARKWMRRH